MFPKIKGIICGCPHNRDYSLLGSVLGPLIHGDIQMFQEQGLELRVYLESQGDVVSRFMMGITGNILRLIWGRKYTYEVPLTLQEGCG